MGDFFLVVFGFGQLSKTETMSLTSFKKIREIGICLQKRMFFFASVTMKLQVFQKKHQFPRRKVDCFKNARRVTRKKSWFLKKHFSWVHFLFSFFPECYDKGVSPSEKSFKKGVNISPYVCHFTIFAFQKNEIFIRSNFR